MLYTHLKIYLLRKKNLIIVSAKIFYGHNSKSAIQEYMSFETFTIIIGRFHGLFRRVSLFAIFVMALRYLSYLGLEMFQKNCL